MTTSLSPSSILEGLDEKGPTHDQQVFFGRRFRNELYAEVLQRFSQAEKGGFTKAELARRLGKDPAQITRWLAAPGNWTVETYAQILLAMGYVPKVDSVRLSELRNTSNWMHPLYIMTRSVGPQFGVVPPQLKFLKTGADLKDLSKPPNKNDGGFPREFQTKTTAGRSDDYDSLTI